MVRLYPFLIRNTYKENHQAAETYPIKPLHLAVKLFRSLTIGSVNDQSRASRPSPGTNSQWPRR